MQFSFVPASELINWHQNEIYNDKYFLYIFVLATKFDKKVLRDCIQYARDLDRLTGERCLLLVFFNTIPSEKKDQLYFDRKVRQKALDGQLTDKDIRRFEEKMTDESYNLARYLGIPEHELPCLVFFNHIRVSEFAVLHIHEGGLSKHYEELRDIISKLYRSNISKFNELDKLDKIKEFGFYNSSHNRLKRKLVNDFLRNNIMHKINRELLNYSGIEFEKSIYYLYENPRDFCHWKKLLNNLDEQGISSLFIRDCRKSLISEHFSFTV